jgi:DNA repair protein RecO (recombination protein O)
VNDNGNAISIVALSNPFVNRLFEVGFDIIFGMPSRERSLRVQAIVLRHSDWGEADRLLWLFTLEMGKLNSLAKGVRRLRSRKAGHLEPFTLVNLLVARGRDMWIITQAEMVEYYLPLREDLVRIGYAAYVVELLDRFTYEEGENRPLFHLLRDTLARVSSMETPALAVRYYELRLLDLVGFRPQLFTCAVCEAEIKPEDQFFSAFHGGVVCPACGFKTSGVRQITVGELRILRHFQRSTFRDAMRLSLTPEIDRSLEVLMQHYFSYLLERGLNSPAFLRQVRRQAITGDESA